MTTALDLKLIADASAFSVAFCSTRFQHRDFAKFRKVGNERARSRLNLLGVCDDLELNRRTSVGFRQDIDAGDLHIHRLPRVFKRGLTPWLTGAGARSAEGTDIGHENAEGMAYVGVRVEPTVRLGSEVEGGASEYSV